MTAETCKNCRFWKQDDEDYEDGQCRAKPPQVAVSDPVGDAVLIAIFPSTPDHWWCGEHQRKVVN